MACVFVSSSTLDSLSPDRQRQFALAVVNRTVQLFPRPRTASSGARSQTLSTAISTRLPCNAVERASRPPNTFVNDMSTRPSRLASN